MDPLSLTQAKRLAASADTLLLRATRPADLETPIGAFLRLDDGITPAYLLESVEGGERLGRYSFLGIGPRRLLEVRDGRGMIQERPLSVDPYDPSLPTTTTPALDPPEAIRAFRPPRKIEPREGMPRVTRRPAGRPAARRDRAVPIPAAGQSGPIPVLRPRAVVRGRRGVARAAPPGRGRQAHDPPDCRDSPPWRHARRGRDPF